nr:Sua5/YciO/YrdC/YwlC family protein [Candidatus Gracilibacteria bacterium]
MLYIIPTDTCFGIACSIDDNDGYKRIYEVKGRYFNKPLAIMVNNYSLFENLLSNQQINFLKNYYRPWTLLLDTNKYELPTIFKKDTSTYVAIRIADNHIEKELINEIGPIFLTSANLSGEKEIYKISELNNLFGNIIDIKILAKKDLENVSPSDIFEFIGDSIEIKYFRKN